MTVSLPRACAGAFALGLCLVARLTSAAQPMTFYGTSLGSHNCPPMGNAQLNIIARNPGTTYTAIRLDNNNTLGTGTLTNAYDLATISNVPAQPVRVVTSDVAYVLLTEYCAGVATGGLTFPAEDGSATVGSRFVYYAAYGAATNNFIAGVTGAPSVTISTIPGATVSGPTAVAAGNAIQPPALTQGQVYLVNSAGGDIAIGASSLSAYSVLGVADSRAASCRNDVGSVFFGRIIPFGGNTGVAVFNDGASASTVTLTQLIGGTNTYSVTANAATSAFLTGVADGVYRFNATNPIAIWAGSPEGGAAIDNLGDDVGIIVGRYDAGTTTYRARARSQTQQSRVFALSGTVVTVNGVATNVGATQNFTVAAAQNLLVTAPQPFILQTQGGNGPNDWGKWLRPLPPVDSDFDNVNDVVEAPGGSCQSTAPDFDGDGLVDFLDADSDNDCVPDSDPSEAGAARTNAALPASAHCTGITPVCTLSGTVGLCQACNGNFGSGAARACNVTTSPICHVSGACVACNGSYGSGSALPCSSASLPVCMGTGACVACNGNYSSGTSSACALSTAPFCSAGQCLPCNGAYGSGAAQACNVAAQPVCLGIGACFPCNGGYGSGQPIACQLPATPVCGGGSCSVCNGDNGSSATQPCPTTANPYCTGTGTCDKCATNNDCIGHSNGPICNAGTGACGTMCFGDGDCTPGTQWCAAAVCTNKTPNGQPLPNVAPINGQCNPANGARVCASGLCSTVDNTCGLKPGDTCSQADGAPSNGDCQSGVCAPNGKCGDCTADSDCGTGTSGKVCNDTTKRCMNGCRGTGGNRCPGLQVCSSTTTAVGTCSVAQPDAGADAGRDGSVPDGSKPAEDASTDATLADGSDDGGEGGSETDGDTGSIDDTGVFEGGGLSCSTSRTPTGTAAVGIGLGLAVLGLVRRKRKKL